MINTALKIWLPTILLSIYCALIVLNLVAFWVVAIFALLHTITLWLATLGFKHLHHDFRPAKVDEVE
jgi:hypothetical protein